MTHEILAALALLMVHIWLLPMMLNLSNATWLLGNRDDPVEFSVLTQRAKRAAANFTETAPVFLTLAILASIQQVDVAELAMYWLGLRVVYLVLYVAGVAYIRSLVWIAALVVLAMMAMALM